MNKKLKPEFVNRLDDLVIFHRLNKDNLKGVLEIELKAIQDRIRIRDIFIELDAKAKEFLIDRGYEPEKGARPLRRKIEEYLLDPLTDEILKNPDEGMRYLITAGEDKLIFQPQEQELATASIGEEKKKTRSKKMKI